jgi:hypothetical protein
MFTGKEVFWFLVFINAIAGTIVFWASVFRWIFS